MKKKLFIVLGLFFIVLTGNIYTYNTTNHNKQIEISYTKIDNDKVVFHYEIYNYQSLVFTIEFYNNDTRLGCENLDMGLSFGDKITIHKLNPFHFANTFNSYVHDYGEIILSCVPKENPHFLTVYTNSNRKNYTDFSKSQFSFDKFNDFKDFQNVDLTKFQYVEGSCNNNILAEMRYKTLRYKIRYFTNLEEMEDHRVNFLDYA